MSDSTSIKIHFMRGRRLAIGLSLILVIASIFSLVTRGVNLSVDFSGGVAMQIALPVSADIASVRDSLSASGMGTATIQAYGENILIRTLDSGEEARKEIMRSLSDKFGDAKVLQIDTVGPVVGEELRVQAMTAIVLAIAGILIYMAFRFTLRFGVAAVIALVHDTLIMLGIYSMTGREISTSFIAAILTVIGYSLNDTIVILDRVRENWRHVPSLGVEHVIDMSLGQTMSRTINTSITTLLPVLAMFFLGGEVISNLAFAFLIGIIVGTYSSIYVAGAIITEWYGGQMKK